MVIFKEIRRGKVKRSGVNNKLLTPDKKLTQIIYFYILKTIRKR